FVYSALSSFSSRSLYSCPLFRFFLLLPHHPSLHSFPTRRSSDLDALRLVQRRLVGDVRIGVLRVVQRGLRPGSDGPERRECHRQDRKSTRLNSSHQIISYAVFCLKKKKNNQIEDIRASISE